MEKCEVFDRVGSCKENVRRNVRYLFKLGVVRSLLGEFEVFDRVGSCKEFVRRIARYRLSWELGVCNARYSIELVVERMLGEM